MKVAVLLLAVLTRAGQAAETLTAFLPSPVTSAHGQTSQVEFATPLMELESGSLAHHLPAAMKNFRFAEPVWVIGYKTTILDAKGHTPPENFLCHTFLADQHVTQHSDVELKGIYSDAFTPEVRLPDGFGILFQPTDPVHWMPMFNNRGDAPTRVSMKVSLTVIRAKHITKPLRPLYGSLRSVQVPHLFFVPPRSRRPHHPFPTPLRRLHPFPRHPPPPLRHLHGTHQRHAQRTHLARPSHRRSGKPYGSLFQCNRLRRPSR